MQKLEQIDTVQSKKATSCRTTVVGKTDSPTGSLDISLHQKEQEFCSIKWRMEELRILFINELTEFAANWYLESARQYVTKHPEITLNLSKDKLASLKSKVKSLTLNSYKIVKNAFSNPNIWWHHSLNLSDDLSQYELLENEDVGKKFPVKIDVPVRCTLGELGAVLEQFGFYLTTIPALKASFPEFWILSTKNPSIMVHPYYPHVLNWSNEMQNLIQHYDTQFKQGIILLKSIEHLKHIKQQHHACKLWDST
ncbi:MAG: hypothetical protein GX638_06815 [Crenarchaeota archaeon]|nr:hypothetical protein [Thermoproteota archaeon]